MNGLFNRRRGVWGSFAIVLVVTMLAFQNAPAADKTDASTLAKPTRKIVDGLNKVIPKVAFAKTPLADSLAFLRDVTALNVVVDWRALEAIGIKRDLPVTADLADVKTGKVIAVVLAAVSSPTSRPTFAGVTDAVVISSPDGLRRVQCDTQSVLDLIAKQNAAPLAKRLPSIQVNQAALADVVDFLRDVSSTNIFVDWKVLDDAGVKRDTKISLTAKDLSLGQAIVLLFDTNSDADVDIQVGWENKVIMVNATKK